MTSLPLGELSAAMAGPAQSAAQTATPAIEARGLCRVIDDRPILGCIDLAIPDGAYVSVLGANGAGKSTLLHLLATLTRASAGELRLFGQAVTRHNAAALRGRIGMIGHQPMLYRHLTARQNLGLFGRLYGVLNPENRADHLLRQVALIDRADEPVATFSRGMVQRVAIARALMHDPSLLLADEPFAGLDVPSARTLEQLLASLHAAGKTIVLTNHDIAQSLRLAQRVVVLRAGTLIANRLCEQTDEATVLAEVLG